MAEAARATMALLTEEQIISLMRRAVREELAHTPASNANEPEYLTTAQVAKLLQTTPRNVRYLVSREGLPALRVGPQGDYRFKRVAVVAYMERKK